MAKKFTHILAHNARDAKTYAELTGIKPNEYRYISNVRVLEGTRPERVVVLSGFQHRKDVLEIAEVLDRLIAFAREKPEFITYI